MSVPRLVSHENPEGRATPLLLLAELREIDPTAELVYFGARDWRVGAVRLSGEARDFRAKKGDQMLDQLERARAEGLHPSPKSFMLGLLLRQGFAQIAQYYDHGDPAGVVTDSDGHETTILADFRMRDWNHRKDQGAEVVAHNAAESGGRTRRAEASRRLRDYLHNDGRDHYNREVRNRVQMGHGGMTGGSGKLLTPGRFNPNGPIIAGPEQVMAGIAEIMAVLGGP